MNIQGSNGQPLFFPKVRTLLEHPEVDVNRRNNDRLTSFMLAMQGGPLGMAARMGHQVWTKRLLWGSHRPALFSLIINMLY